MDGRPPKRQRRSIHPEAESQEPPASSRPSKQSAVSLLSRPKASERSCANQTPSARIPSSSPSPKKTASSPKPAKSQSLHSFFQPATEGQRWSTQKFESKRSLPTVTDNTLDADVIEDDYDSYDEIFTQHLAGVKSKPAVDTKVTSVSSRTQRPASRQPATSRPKKQRAQRFLMSTESDRNPHLQPPTKSQSEGPDCRPWAQRFAPLNLDENAVHKRKVSDVQRWLEDVFAERRREVSPHVTGTALGRMYYWGTVCANGNRDYWFYEALQDVGRRRLSHSFPNRWGLMSSNGEIQQSPNILPGTTSQ